MRTVRAQPQERQDMNNAWIPRKAIKESHHFQEMARQRVIDTRLVRAGIGLDVLSITDDDRLRCLRSTSKSGDLVAPTVGRPVHIGRYLGVKGSAREVLLVVLPNGQRAHVVAAFDAKRMDLITVWCPDAPENELKWQPHALLPTRSGDRCLPDTHWFLGDPARSDRPLAGVR